VIVLFIFSPHEWRTRHSRLTPLHDPIASRQSLAKASHGQLEIEWNKGRPSIRDRTKLLKSEGTSSDSTGGVKVEPPHAGSVVIGHNNGAVGGQTVEQSQGDDN
jgi:hypothetical protein